MLGMSPHRFYTLTYVDRENERPNLSPIGMLPTLMHFVATLWCVSELCGIR